MSDADSLIEAESGEAENMSDGALRLPLKIAAADAQRAIDLFGSRNTEMGLMLLGGEEVVPAFSGKFKTLASGAVHLLAEIQPAMLRTAYRLFGTPKTKLILAAIKPEHLRQRAAEAQQRQQQRMEARGGSKAALAAQWCGDPQFQQWAAVTYPEAWSLAVEALPDGKRADLAAQVVRSYCWINSRAELDSDENAWRRFNEQFRQPFMAWKGQQS